MRRWHQLLILICLSALAWAGVIGLWRWCWWGTLAVVVCIVIVVCGNNGRKGGRRV